MRLRTLTLPGTGRDGVQPYLLILDDVDSTRTALDDVQAVQDNLRSLRGCHGALVFAETVQLDTDDDWDSEVVVHRQQDTTVHDYACDTEHTTGPCQTKTCTATHVLEGSEAQRAGLEAWTSTEVRCDQIADHVKHIGFIPGTDGVRWSWDQD